MGGMDGVGEWVGGMDGVGGWVGGTKLAGEDL